MRTSLGEIARVFLKLGTTAFGGPAAHIAMMEEDVVRRRSWISREDFLDLLGATHLIPGPNSTELAIHIGHRQAGWRGLLVAGTCFILPAALIVSAIAWAYVKYGSLPEVGALLYGIKPVIIAVVLQALWGFGKTALKTRTLTVLGFLAVTANLLGANEILVILIAGTLAMASRRKATGALAGSMTVLASGLLPTKAALAAAAVMVSEFTLAKLFLFFLKIGSVLFGSGYVLLAFLRADLVEHWHWLTEAQLLDATAVGQFTPGPVFTTATFIGYLLGGFPGAVIATIGIFLPAFFFVAVSAPLIPRLRRSPGAAAFLDGVNVASLSLMAVVSVHLGKAALIDPLTFGIAILSGLLLVRYRVNSAWLVLLGAIAGLVARAL